MTALVLDRSAGIEHTVACGHGDRRREVRDSGHQLRAGRRRSGLLRLETAFARSACRSHPCRWPGGFPTDSGGLPRTASRRTAMHVPQHRSHPGYTLSHTRSHNRSHTRSHNRDGDAWLSPHPVGGRSWACR